MQLNLRNFDKSVIVPFSTIDWHGKVAMVIFLRGCNLRCPYCQNFELWTQDVPIDTHEILSEIRKNKDFVNAVIFSGGEPTLHFKLLEKAAQEVKKIGLLVGIETNGTFPQTIVALINSALLDGLFIDVKAPLSDRTHYSTITGCDVSKDQLNRIRRSIEAGLAAVEAHKLLELEIRTTVFKGLLTQEDICAISKEYPQINYALQQGQAEYSKNSKLQMVSRKDLIAMAKKCSRTIRIRTKESGEEIIHPD